MTLYGYPDYGLITMSAMVANAGLRWSDQAASALAEVSRRCHVWTPPVLQGEN
jgi:hypothetical protein